MKLTRGNHVDVECVAGRNRLTLNVAAVMEGGDRHFVEF